ncbi:hypothetical protein ACX3VG_14030 [Escherichia coli]
MTSSLVGSEMCIRDRLSPLFELKSPGCKVWAFVVLGRGKVLLCS